MLEQAQAFLDESDALDSVVDTLDDAALMQTTQFKTWTIADVIRHLHFWNRAADLALTDGPSFKALYADAMAFLQAGGSLSGFEAETLADLTGRALVAAWRERYRQTAERFGNADPKTRVLWAGPDMSVRSCITARQMETWAHGHEVFDQLGRQRTESDRLKNIVFLGVNTFGWSFKVHGLPVPAAMPYLSLTAPSGAHWTWGDPADTDRIDGSALAFAQVVTQVRHVDDTDLRPSGPIAEQWMANAQCFAGPPETPPAPGTRFRRQ